MTTNRTVELPVTDGSTLPVYLARPDGEVAPVAVIVAHELFGVNPDIRDIVDQLAEAGHVAIAPEFYHRSSPPGGWLERDDDGRNEGFRLLHLLERDQAIADVAAGIEWLSAQPGVEKTAIVGFSAGGHLAYLAASRLPIARTAVLYGGWLPSTAIPLSRPEPTLDLTPGITGTVLYLVGDDDSLIDDDERAQIESALTQADVPHEVVRYAGTQHAFFWPGTPAYNESARADAWSRILAMLAG